MSGFPGVPLDKIPTDNLYKFLTVFGLVLVIIGVFGPPFFTERIHAEYVDQLNRTNTLLLQNEKERDQIKRGETINLVQWLKQKQEMLRSYEIRFNWCLGVGACLSGGGFIAWFFRVQRYQDCILRKEAAKDPATNSPPSKPKPEEPAGRIRSSANKR